MEWLIVAPIVALVLLCPLMMIGMIAAGWIMARRGKGSGHGGHGMMCMGHGAHGSHDSPADVPRSLVDDLKAERERLDQLIAEAEEEISGREEGVPARGGR